MLLLVMENKTSQLPPQMKSFLDSMNTCPHLVRKHIQRRFGLTASEARWAIKQYRIEKEESAAASVLGPHANACQCDFCKQERYSMDVDGQRSWDSFDFSWLKGVCA